MNGDGELNVLDSAMLLEKYVRGTNAECGCDPTFNSRTDLNDFNILSLATVTGLLVFDRSSTVSAVVYDASAVRQLLVVQIYLKCSGCAASEGCSEHVAAFSATTVKVLVGTSLNWQLSAIQTHGGVVESSSPGLVSASTEHVGDGFYELRLQRQGGAPFAEERSVGMAVHQYKGTRRWGWNDDSADVSTTSVRAAHVFDMVLAEPTPAPAPTAPPTQSPTKPPTAAPTRHPTSAPTAPATQVLTPPPPPTAAPTRNPTSAPTASAPQVPTPTLPPTAVPTHNPTSAPTAPAPQVPTPPLPVPTIAPTRAPTRAQTAPPTRAPTALPTSAHTLVPGETYAPTDAPTDAPTAGPTVKPAAMPTSAPTGVLGENFAPTAAPTTAPPPPTPALTAAPSRAPTPTPSLAPSAPPSRAPTSPPPPTDSGPCAGACDAWSQLALQAACPRRFRLVGGALKAASLAAWEGGLRTGSDAATCSITSGVGEIASMEISYESFPRITAAPTRLRFIVYNSDLFSSSHRYGNLALGSTLRVAYQVQEQNHQHKH